MSDLDSSIEDLRSSSSPEDLNRIKAMIDVSCLPIFLSVVWFKFDADLKTNWEHWAKDKITPRIPGADGYMDTANPFNISTPVTWGTCAYKREIEVKEGYGMARVYGILSK